ncbi:MAG TPA: penicillin-binding protein activator LpoB [Planctomycetota bacterium]|nr:penicillin-binding protein activator LpoB [Planctomycetota bacterium]
MKQTQPLLAACAVLLAGCASSVKYDDPAKVETMTIDWGSTDLQTMAGAMVNSMILSPNLAYLERSGKGDDKRIIVYTGRITNRTSEHIDTEAINDRVRTALVQSGKFRLAPTPQGQDELAEQVRFQQGSGRVDPSQAAAFGKQIGADAVLVGNLRSIEKTKDRSLADPERRDDVFYQFTMELVNVETGEVIWSELKDIRKTRKKGLFG